MSHTTELTEAELMRCEATATAKEILAAMTLYAKGPFSADDQTKYEADVAKLTDALVALVGVPA